LDYIVRGLQDLGFTINVHCPDRVACIQYGTIDGGDIMAIGSKKGKTTTVDRKVLEDRRNKRALRLFTNRDDEREILKKFFSTIHTDGVELEQPILSLYGVGGVGKTSLLRQSWHEFKESYPDSDLCFVHVDLDSQNTESTLTSVKLLWKIRCQIYEKARVPLYLFDLLYLKYMEKNQEPVEDKDGPIMNTLNAMGSGEVFGSILESAGEIVDVSKIGQLVGKGFNWLWGNLKQKQVAENFKLDIDSFNKLNYSELESLMPKVFADELGMSLIEQREHWAHRKVDTTGIHDFTPSIWIAFDGYERVSKSIEKVLVEDFLMPILTNEDYYPHFGFLFAGREQFDWHDYDQSLQEVAGDGERWKVYIDSHRLGGLTEKYVDQFTSEAIKFYRNEGEEETANRIGKHASDIKATCDDDGVYHPFYLDLCLEAIDKHGDQFDLNKHLGKTPGELIGRFLKYLDSNGSEWHRAFALAGEFDEELFESLVEAKSISGNLQAFYQFVYAYSYITPQQTTDSWKFHRLMQDSLIGEMASLSEFERNALKKAVVDKLIAFYDSKLLDRKMESLNSRSLEYLQRGFGMVTESIRAQLITIEDGYSTFYKWSETFNGAFFSVTEPIARDWVELHKKYLGDKHPDVAISLNNLASILMDQGNYSEAESLLRELLAMQKELLGDNHPDVAFSLNNLAVVLGSQGKYDEAERLYLMTLNIFKELFSDGQLDLTTGLNYYSCTASSLNMLAGILSSQGKHKEAERLISELQTMRKKLPGDNSQGEANNLNSLAGVLSSQGKYSEAESLYRESLAMKKELFGDKHPDVATVLHNRAVALDSQGNYSEAESLYRESLAMKKELLGDKHPDVALSLDGLALVSEAQGKHKEAEGLFRESLAIKKGLLGAMCQADPGYLDHLASTLCSQGKYEEAADVFRESLAMRKELLGGKCPEIATSLNNLAVVLDLQDKCSEAESLHRESLAMRKELLGDKHPDVALSLDNLAYVLDSEGKYSEAEALCRELLAMRKERLGDKHPDVATSLNNLASALEKQGKYSEAESLHRESLAMRKEQLGDKHPDVALSLDNLASVLDSQGKCSEAEDLFRESLAIRRELLGDKHPDVALSLDNLAYVLESQGNHSEAELLYRESLAMRKEQLGDKHPDVATDVRNLGLILALQNKYYEANKYLQEALAISLYAEPCMKLDVLKAKIYLAIVYHKDNKFELSSDFLARATNILNKLLITNRSTTQEFIKYLCSDILPQLGMSAWAIKFDDYLD